VRERGIYGAAVVSYRITQSAQNVRPVVIAPSDMFAGEAGLVMFADRQFNAELTLSLLHTGIPHFDLHYVLQLLSVTGVSVFI